MRVAWLSHNVPYPPVGGVLQRNFNLVREIARRAELHLVALRQRVMCPDDEALSEAQRALEGLCASVRIFEIDWEVSRARRLAHAARLLVRPEPYDVVRYRSRDAGRFLSSGALPPVDLVHVDTLGLIPYRRFCPSAPSVLNHHNIESHMLERRAASEARPLLRAALAWQARRTRVWERRQAPTFGCNLVVSELDGERLREVAPGARCALVPNGVDTSYFSAPANDEPENHRIVMVGTHAWYPNRDAALYFLDEIWPRIVEREPRASWIVIGQDPDARVLEAARRDERIQVRGFVEDLRKSVAEAAVFVCPFREGGGTRLKVLDALAMRKALVSTTKGAEGISIEDGRHYLRADTAAAFAGRVVELFRDPGLRVKLGEAGRDLVVERFDWSRVGADLHRAYETAIDASRGSEAG